MGHSRAEVREVRGSSLGDRGMAGKVGELGDVLSWKYFRSDPSLCHMTLRTDPCHSNVEAIGDLTGRGGPGAVLGWSRLARG